MEVMFRVLSDPELHKSASEGFKKVGQSIDLHGKEDALICREAGVFWNEETTDNYPSMRPKIDVELAAVAGEFASGGIAWSEHDVQRLITPYPPRPKVDRILENLGQDFYHDHIHDILDDDGAGGDDAASDSSKASDNRDSDDEPSADDVAAVAGDDVPSVEIVAIECSPGQADAAHRGAQHHRGVARDHRCATDNRVGRGRAVHPACVGKRTQESAKPCIRFTRSRGRVFAAAQG